MCDEQNERYRLGLPDMDAQHHYLYALFDRLEPSATVTDAAAAAPLLAEIERYLLYHFACEEHLMRMYKFPQFAAHQGDHAGAENKLGQFLNDFEQRQLNPARLRLFLTGWLMEHSRLSDAVYVAWIKQCRDEQTQSAAASEPPD